MTRRVGDLATDDFVALGGDTRVDAATAAAGNAAYVVVTAADGSLSGVLATKNLRECPGTIALSELVREGLPLVTVPAEVDPAVAAKAPVMNAVWPPVAIVVAGDDIVGVWAGPDLAGALLSAGGGSRSPGDWALLGKVDQIPQVRRACGHESQGGKCLAVVAFSEKPDEMPDCPNPNALRPHSFVW